jgi:hypothetical protein
VATVLIYNPDMANQAITWLIKGHKNWNKILQVQKFFIQIWFSTAIDLFNVLFKLAYRKPLFIKRAYKNTSVFNAGLQHMQQCQVTFPQFIAFMLLIQINGAW